MIYVPENILLIPYKNLDKNIGNLCKDFFNYDDANLKISAVTGTNGKTTTCHLVHESIKLMNKESALIGTMGYGKSKPYKDNFLTTPGCIELHGIINELIDQNIEYTILEASSHGLSQDRLDGIDLSTAAFTNLTYDHLDYHGSIDNYKNSKLRLFNDSDIKKAVINIDNPFGTTIFKSLSKSIDKLAVSFEESSIQGSLIKGSIVQNNQNGLIIDVESDFGRNKIKSPLFGKFNAENLLLSLGILLSEGFELKDIIESLNLAPLPSGRMELVNGFNDQKIFIDYAHTPDALENALKTLKQIHKGKLCIVFGCGGDRDKKKRSLMGTIAERYANEIIITDDNPRSESSDNIINDIVKGISNKDNIQIISDRFEAIHYAIKSSNSNDVILISGKGHENKQIYNTKEYDFSDLDCIQRILKINE